MHSRPWAHFKAWAISSPFREIIAPTRAPVVENRLDTESMMTTFSAASENASMVSLFPV